MAHDNSDIRMSRNALDVLFDGNVTDDSFLKEVEDLRAIVNAIDRRIDG
jgi:hypothetical protein